MTCRLDSSVPINYLQQQVHYPCLTLQMIIAIFMALVFTMFPCRAASPSDQATPIVGSLWPASRDGKWGYIDNTGKFIVPPIYQGVYDFSGGYAGVMLDHKIGFIDETGKVVLKPQFTNITNFSEGLARVVVSERFLDSFNITTVTRFIDVHGRQAFARECESTYHPTLITPAPFALISMPMLPRLFHEGLAAARDGNRIGYIDKTGSFAIAPAYEYASDFSEGVAVVTIEGKYRIIDTKGNLVANLPSGVESVDDSREGLLLAVMAGKRGFLSHKGEWVLSPRHEYVSPFFEGLALIAVQQNSAGSFGCKQTTRRLVGYMDHSGKTVIGPQFEDTLNNRFSEGLAAAKRAGEDKVGYIDKKGKFVIKPEFYSGGTFRKGLARVYVKDRGGKYFFGYINTRGQYVWREK